MMMEGTTMESSTSRKRKNDGSLSWSNPRSQPALKRFRPALHAIQIHANSENEHEAFPTDRITSDPTFFDDFMPDEPQPTLTSSQAKPALSPVPTPGSRHSVRESWLSDDENADTTVQTDPDRQDSSLVINTIQQKPESVGTIVQALETPDPHKVLATSREELVVAVQEDTISNTAREGIPEIGCVEVQSQASKIGPEIAQTQSDPVSPVGDPRGASVAANTMPNSGFSKHNTPEDVESRDGTLPSADSIVPQPVNPSDTISTHMIDTIPETSSEYNLRSSREAGASSNLSSSLISDAAETCSSTLVTTPASIKRGGKPRKRARIEKGGLQFEIGQSQKDHAYSVKHRKETRPEIGDQWSRAVKRDSIHTSITKHARVKYAVGDVVSLSFPEGDGGSAKIVEIRDADEDMPVIVVQWLYTRTDAARLGGKLPSLEKWPKGLYVLSDHFQVVCVENLDGKSGSTLIDDVYFQIGAKSLQPTQEFNRRLQQQLG